MRHPKETPMNARQTFEPSRSRFVFAAALALLVAACTSVEVTPEAGALEQLRRPDRVLVYNFAVTPQEIQLDAVGSAITNTLDGTADSVQEQQVGHAVADALAKHLVSSINGMGLNAVRASGPAPSAGTDLLIMGQLVSIDEGSAAERMIIGLGAGQQPGRGARSGLRERRRPKRPDREHDRLGEEQPDAGRGRDDGRRRDHRPSVGLDRDHRRLADRQPDAERQRRFRSRPAGR